ncbi:DNA repair protein RAD16 [Nosema granulosis]|uniref:DNA repair protein RAD16 n=1 Tax=Nosema granulosis TaxID=83296 RepID=A0A9P6KY41_9MICR|nr:DNA repair protein RAD16 [Nosema granulosis]
MVEQKITKDFEVKKSKSENTYEENPIVDPRKDIIIYKEEAQALKEFRKLTPIEKKKIQKRLIEDNNIDQTHEGFLKKEDILEIVNTIDAVEPPKGLVTRLLDYQLFGISWMIDREKSQIKGGILADQMGMGKTLQMIGLMLSGDYCERNLIIVPTIALNQWVEELEKHSPGMFNIYRHHGRLRISEVFCDFNKNNTRDIFITTYGTIESDYRRKKNNIFKIAFDRVILDEAHIIKDSRSNTNTAITHIKAKYRWGLTGTPVQNRVGDLFSLVKFLKLDPYSYYFCKKCPCKSMFWLRYNEKTDLHSRGFCVCGHFSAQHFGWWNRRIATPIKELGYTEEGKQVFEKLHKITSNVVLRRTKASIEHELGLPSKVVVVDRLFFNENELDFYTSLYGQSKNKYNEYLIRGQVSHNYAHIFDLLQKMRLATNHPFLAIKKDKTINSDIPICGFCNEEADDPVFSKCKHVFCREEAKNFLADSPLCPVCKINITIDLNQVYNYNIETKIDPSTWISSTKIEYLIQKLVSLRDENVAQKSIVFSQYVNFLEILRWRLERAGFRCVKIYGNMLISQRKAAIDIFNKDSHITVFLISLKAGGVALNLTEANNVFLMDLWWNPAVEEQAMDRIHRIGQHRPIRIHRIIIENSIESKILLLQKKKKALFDSSIEKNYSAIGKLSEDDLHFLFN